MSDIASTATLEPAFASSDPFAQMPAVSAKTETAESGTSSTTSEHPIEEVSKEDVALLESATADLRLQLLVWSTRLALTAMLVVGLIGLLLGGLALTQKPDAATAAALQQRCLLHLVLCAGFGMIAAATRAGATDRRREIARAIAKVTAERARREAARAREAARKAAAEREAAENAQREAKLAAQAEEEARYEAEEAERLALLGSMEDTARLELERQAAEAQKAAERKAMEEKIERAIRDGTRVG